MMWIKNIDNKRKFTKWLHWFHSWLYHKNGKLHYGRAEVVFTVLFLILGLLFRLLYQLLKTSLNLY